MTYVIDHYIFLTAQYHSVEFKGEYLPYPVFIGKRQIDYSEVQNAEGQTQIRIFHVFRNCIEREIILIRTGDILCSLSAHICRHDLKEVCA